MTGPAHERPPRRSGVDRCPAVLGTHEAADGHLVRVRLPGGALSADALDAVAALADDGNGIIEITARANLQVRGLAAAPTTAHTRRLRLAGLLPSERHERARNILASPLAGRHPSALAATDRLVAAIDRGLCADPALAALSGRFLFAVDDGSGAMARQGADIGLVAERDEAGRVRFRLVLDGVPTTWRVHPAAAALAALAAARAFLALRDHSHGRAWRVGDIARGADHLARRLGTRRHPSPPAVRHLDVAAGSLVQRDGAVAVTAVAPLGRLSPEALRRLAGAARRLGVGVRTSPWRTVTLVDVDPAATPSARGALERAGFVVDDADGWHRLSACAGLGACSKAKADVRWAAALRARDRGRGSPAEHWSACERRCGEPPSPGVRAVAIGGGAVVVSRPRGRVEVADLDQAVALLGPADGP